MVRGGAGVVLVACLATGVDAFSGISLPLKGHRYPTYCYKDSSAIPLAALKMQATPKDFASDSHALSRRIAIGIFGACTLQALPVGAEDAEIPSKAGPAVCDKVLGCEIKGQLTPPRRVYRDIFEEERERAKEMQAAQDAERKKSQRGELLILQGQFAQIKKGRVDLEREMTEAVAKASAEGAEEQQLAWDDLRRMARLYDTGIRKDGMDQVQGRVRKLKLDFDKATAEGKNKELNKALSQLDKAGKKKDVKAAKELLSNALAAIDSWLALEPRVDL